MRANSRPDAITILGYVKGHHILPKSFNLGGKSDKNNIAFLSALEHFIVHFCLYKMFNGKFKTVANSLATPK